MGFRNNQVGYPTDILSSRAIIKKDNFCLIPPDGLVKNIIPGFENCDVSILSSPKLGATFVDYKVTLLEDGKNILGFGGDGVEVFLFVLSGNVKVSIDNDIFELSTNGYVYCPPDKKVSFENIQKENSELFLYKRRYKAIEGFKPYVFSQNLSDVKPINYEDMHNVLIYDLLPKTLDFDMNFHILAFEPGASHGYIETHVQEHGAIILSGEGVYNLDNNWIPVKKDDYIFMGAYSLQACYAVGKESLSYLYSKDCNRDEEI